MTAPEQHPAADQLIAAVLAVTPRMSDGRVAVDYWTEVVDEHDGGQPGEYELPNDGPAEPIAARQAVAVLRWAAEWLGEPWMERNAGSLDDLADEIEAAR